MDEQKLQTSLITRSTSKNSVGHRRIVNFLENLSRDKDGAPARWTFTKSGIHKAKGVRKKIALNVAKKIGSISTKKLLKSNTSKSQKMIGEESNKDSETGNERKSHKLDSEKSESALRSESLIVTVERFEGTVQADDESDSVNLESKGPVIIKRKPGRPKVSKEIKNLSEQQKTEISAISESSTGESEVVKVKRGPGRPKKNSTTWTTLSKKVYSNAIKKAVNSSVKLSSNNREENYDSSESSSVSNMADSGDNQRRKVKSYNRHEGIKLGPRKMLRSQDNLVTRQKRGRSSMPVLGGRRKRTLSGEFHLLEEPTRKKKAKTSEKNTDCDGEEFQKELHNDEIENADVNEFEENDFVLADRNLSVERDKSELKIADTSSEMTDVEKDDIQISKKRKLEIVNVKPLNVDYTNKGNIVVQPIPVKRKPGRPPKSSVQSVQSVINDRVNKQDHLSLKSQDAASLMSQVKFRRSGKSLSPVSRKNVKEEVAGKETFSRNEDSNVQPKPRGRPKSLESKKAEQHLSSSNRTFQDNTLGRPDGKKSDDKSTRRSLKIVGPGGLKFTKANAKETFSNTNSENSSKADLLSEPMKKVEKVPGISDNTTREVKEINSKIVTIQTVDPNYGSKWLGNDKEKPENVNGLSSTSEINFTVIDKQLDVYKDLNFSAVSENMSEKASVSKLEYVENIEKCGTDSDDSALTHENVIFVQVVKEQENTIINYFANTNEREEGNLNKYDNEKINSVNSCSGTLEMTDSATKKLDLVDVIGQNDMFPETSDEKVSHSNHVPNADTNMVSEISEQDRDIERVEKDIRFENVNNSSVENCEKIESVDLHNTTVTTHKETDNIIMSDVKNVLNEGKLENESNQTEKRLDDSVMINNEIAEKVSLVGNQFSEEPVESASVDDRITLLKDISEQSNFLKNNDVPFYSDKSDLKISKVNDESCVNSSQSNFKTGAQKTVFENMTKNIEEDSLSSSNFEDRGESIDGKNDVINNSGDQEAKLKLNSESEKVVGKVESNINFMGSKNKVDGTASNLINSQENSHLIGLYESPGISKAEVTTESQLPKVEETSFRDSVFESKVCVEGQSTEVSNKSSGQVELGLQQSDDQEMIFESDSSFEKECSEIKNIVPTPADIGTHEKLSSCEQTSLCSLSDKGKRSDSLNTSTKRVFQLRQKASRSPLEIIAMRQSQEERQYMLEQTKKAIKREEKQRKMRSKFQNIISEKSLEKESEEPDYVSDVERLCKPCSVVLIDFVKYLKDTQSSCDTGATDYEDSENVDTEEENEETSISCDIDVGSKPEDIQETVDLNVAQPTSGTADVETLLIDENSTGHATKKSATNKCVLKNNIKKKRRPSARKQMKSYTCEAKFIAEIVPNSDNDSQSQATVPPLRLKIKGQDVLNKNTVPPLKLKLNQKTLTKGRMNKQQKGTVPFPRRRKARKGFSPVKSVSESVKLLDSVQNETTNSQITKPAIPEKPGFEGSFVKFINDKELPSKKCSSSKPQVIKETVTCKLNTDVKTIEDLGKTMVHTETPRCESDSSHFTTPVKTVDGHVENYEKEFICKTCDFVTSSRNIMESHIYVHLKNVPFKCVYCQRTFRSRGVAFIHMRSVHPDQEAKMETAEDIDESDYYKEVIKSIPAEQQTIVQTNIASLQQSPDSLIISVVLPRNVTEPPSGRYCCSYCSYTASSQQGILDHINSNHRHDIQYTCSLCEKAVFGYKEGIAQHFAEVHPNKPVMYKCLPDFYDRKGNNEKATANTSQDKGNIFERMNDLFSNSSNTPIANESLQDHFLGKRTSLPEKTSAEADSTTPESDELVMSSEKDNSEKEKNLDNKIGHFDSSSTEIEKEQCGLQNINTQSMPDENSEKQVDGIEELAKIYGESVSQVENESEIDLNQSDATSENKGPGLESINVSAEQEHKEIGSSINESSEVENDMGLKIIDVVSLRDQVTDSGAFSAETWGEEILEGNTSKASENENIMPKEPTPSINNNGTISQHSNLPKPKELTPTEQTPTVDSSSKTSEKTGTTYKCERCCVHAPFLSTMVEHLRSSHKDINRLFLCPFCRQYEGSTEPDIHRHIKQFHDSPHQKSPPVALSGAAKKHLRTIQVPVGDSVKITDGKPIIEKDIYKCLKCQKHMPSLDYIYDHLEKDHNEVFVYVCPDCKKFRAKEEEVVYNHIKVDHQKNTDNIILSLAIEENLFTRVQSLIKDKSGQSKSASGNKTLAPSTQAAPQNPQQTVIRPTSGPQFHNKNNQNEYLGVGESRISQNVLGILPEQRFQIPMQTRMMQPVMSSSVQNLQIPVMPPANRPPPPAHALQNPISLNHIQSKSALRKSRPVQIRPHLMENTQNSSNVNRFANFERFNIPQPSSQNSHIQQSQNLTPQAGPPPLLMRGPPPLLRFDPVTGSSATALQTSSVLTASNMQQRSDNYSHTSSVRNVSFPMTDKLHRKQSSTGSSIQSPEPYSRESGRSPSGRPLLRVPSVSSVLGSPKPSLMQDVSNSSYTKSVQNERSRLSDSSAGAPLDLSKAYESNASQNSSSKGQVENDDVEEIPADAFQIFNLRPSAPVQNRPPIANTMQPFTFQSVQQQQMNQGGGIQRAMQPHMVQGLSNQGVHNRLQRPPGFLQRGILRPPYQGPSSRFNSVSNVPVYHTSSTSVPRQMGHASNVTPENITNMATLQVFKCPYCPNVVPLSMGDVAPHIEKFHPGHSIVFMKKDS